MSYNVTGTAGNDTLDRSADSGPGTIVGLAGTDCIFTGSGLATITGDAGADTIVLRAGNTGTIAGGGENDSISATVDTGAMMAFGNDGADTIFFFSASGSDTAPISVPRTEAIASRRQPGTTSSSGMEAPTRCAPLPARTR